MLSAHNLTVRIGPKTLLQGVSLELHPDSGSVSINGGLLSSWDARQAARMRGVLPQSSALAFRFNVLEVVLMGRSPHRKTHTHVQNETIVRHALMLTDTGHLADRIYTTLSGGECQRVQLARVLAQIWEPCGELHSYLLLDEPTSALDLAHQHAVLAIARHFADANQVGVLAILHDLNLAALYADRIAVLHCGHMIIVDSPGQVLNSELIQRVFDYPVSIDSHPLYPDCPLLITHRQPREALL